MLKTFVAKNKPLKTKGTNGQKNLIYAVHGIADFKKHKGGASWCWVGYEFDTFPEAQSFYKEHKIKK